MICEYCERPNHEGHVTCEGCGAPVESFVEKDEWIEPKPRSLGRIYALVVVLGLTAFVAGAYGRWLPSSKAQSPTCIQAQTCKWDEWNDNIPPFYYPNHWNGRLVCKESSRVVAFIHYSHMDGTYDLGLTSYAVYEDAKQQAEAKAVCP